MINAYIPDAAPLPDALSRTTHLGIGAHADDLEFMAFHGILAGYESPTNWFSGVTCTNGAGSPRAGDFASLRDEEMITVRHHEQNTAADIGHYAAQFQLGLPSSKLRSPQNSTAQKHLMDIIKATQPEVIYTHNPADKHPTHVNVFLTTLAALRSLGPDYYPQSFLGCEVWRDLDWLPDSKKVTLDISAHPNLRQELCLTFQSQVEGGKDYYHAIKGRSKAHATFHNPHRIDNAYHLSYAINLCPLLHQSELSPSEFILSLIDEFKDEVHQCLCDSDEKKI